MKRLAQCRHLTSISQHFPDDVNNLVHTVYESDRGKHSEHLKAGTWLGEEEQHGQRRGKLPRFSIPGGEILVLTGKKRKCMTEQEEIL